MRSQTRNQQRIYWARIVPGNAILDEYGNETSERHKIYDAIHELWINVGPAKGSIYQNPFGASVQYNKVLSISDPTLFTEDDVGVAFWIGKEPPETIVQDKFSHNYELRGVAASLNELRIAAGRANVS